MGFFQKIGNAFARFMYGRNGGDQLGLFMIWVAIMLDIVGIFIKNDVVYLAKRRAENARFLQKVWWPLKGKLHRLKDREHRYFTCPNCRTVCRVPRGKGKIVITCPKCRGEIHGKS